MRVDKTFGASVVAMLFRIQKFASEAEAVAHVKGLKTQAKAQAGPLVAVGDNDDAFKVMAPLTGCLNAEHLTNR